MIVLVLVSIAITALVAFGLTRWFAGGGGVVILDHPNERSLHDVPMPRTGGLAIVAALVAGHLMALAGGHSGVVIGALATAGGLVFLISVLDDFNPLPAALRMLVHVLAALALVWAGVRFGGVSLPGMTVALAPWLGALVTVLFVVWLINLYNFMDGMDGFAAGMGCIGFGCYALLGFRAGDGGFALSAAIVAAACAGFLVENFPPARIFMGDAGSSVLGFLAAGLTVYAERAGVFPLWVGVVVFSPFIVDASVTLLRRALAGDAVWRAHRSHYYQRLVGLGWGHRRTTAWGYVLMLGCAALALAAHGRPPVAQWLALLGLAAIYAILMWSVHRMERRRS